jgi:hypothetical protein
MNTDWSKEAPTQPGLYWFYGDYRRSIGDKLIPLKPELLFMTVKLLGGNSLKCYTHGEFKPIIPFDETAMEKHQEGFLGFWKPIDVPELPPFNVNARIQKDV